MKSRDLVVVVVVGRGVVLRWQHIDIYKRPYPLNYRQYPTGSDILLLTIHSQGLLELIRLYSSFTDCLLHKK